MRKLEDDLVMLLVQPIDARFGETPAVTAAAKMTDDGKEATSGAFLWTKDEIK